MDIIDHPILGKLTTKKNVTIYFEGKKLLARDGITVAAALMSEGSSPLDIAGICRRPGACTAATAGVKAAL